jgi:uncharacterized membrane protein (UPF0127 family)
MIFTARLALRTAGLWLLLATAACAQAGYKPEPLDRFPQSSVEVISGEARHRFDVWVADTAARQVQGLMYVRRLDPDRGMLFIYGEPRYLSYWMYNTYVSLDLLFIGEDGRIINIVESAAPLSTNPLLSMGPAKMVLEVLAGTCERLGIKAGDRLVHPAQQAALAR